MGFHLSRDGFSYCVTSSLYGTTNRKHLLSVGVGESPKVFFRQISKNEGSKQAFPAGEHFRKRHLSLTIHLHLHLPPNNLNRQTINPKIRLITMSHCEWTFSNGMSTFLIIGECVLPCQKAGTAEAKVLLHTRAEKSHEALGSASGPVGTSKLYLNKANNVLSVTIFCGE